MLTPAPQTATLPTANLQTYIHNRQPWWNVLAFAYMGLGYLGGLSLILLPHWGGNVLGVFFLTHGLVLSAYLTHELMHGTIFESIKANTRLGQVLLWVNGACCTPFTDLARLHIAHHVNRVDFYQFDLAAYMQALPVWQRRGLLFLEWCYFPALAFLSRWRANLAPFWTPERTQERRSVVLIFLVRMSLFTLLGILSLKALLLYFLAYIGMITVLRFMDAFQHTYEVFPIDTPLPERDHAHEQANTFTNLLSPRFSWLNLLLLNFGYHNAHHEVMKCPWYRLPALERDLYTVQNPQQVPLGRLLVNYHKFRLTRIFEGQGTTLNPEGERCLEQFYGGIEVSFLVFPA